MDPKLQAPAADSPAQPAGLAIRADPEPRCYLCGSPGAPLYHGLSDSIFSAAGRWSISRCLDGNCGLLWLDPMPLAEDLPAAYTSYYTHGEPAKTGIYRAGKFLYSVLAGCLVWPAGILLDRRRAELMFLGDRRPGALLDVGCGDGAFLARMRSRGWSVTGVDFDPAAAAAAKDRYGLEVQVGTLEEAFAGRRASFDVVTASHVIEHVPDPVGFLKQCRSLLRPGGRVVLKTPNASSYGARRYGSAWRGLEPPRHLHIFRAPALISCARKAGFAVSACFTSAAGADGILVASRFIARKNSFREDELSVAEKIEVRLARPFLALTAKLAWLRDRDCGEELCAILVNSASQA
jgi:SAM-dependent methyltransferase